MSNREKVDKFFKAKPVGLGSYEVNKQGKVDKREISIDEEIKNELSYFKSSSREKSLTELDKKIYEDSGLDKILEDKLVNLVLTSEGYLQRYVDYLEKFLPADELIYHLDDLDWQLVQIIPELENLKNRAIEKRLDYKNFGNYAVDTDIKSEFEKLIDYIDNIIEQAKFVQDYLQNKKINL